MVLIAIVKLQLAFGFGDELSDPLMIGQDGFVIDAPVERAPMAVESVDDRACLAVG